MRCILPFALLAVAGCATRPAPAPVRPVVPVQQPRETGDLIGATAADLASRFGQPALQVREGAGVKLQFRGRCVLDAYLYPPAGGGLERVTHVDTRLPSGADTDQRGCIGLLQGA